MHKGASEDVGPARVKKKKKERRREKTSEKEWGENEGKASEKSFEDTRGEVKEVVKTGPPLTCVHFKYSYRALAF